MGLLSKAQGNAASKDNSNLLEDTITKYYRQFKVLNCIIFEGHGTLKGRLVQMIGNTGVIIPLALERQLILLSPSQDRELIAHRLSRSLNTGPLLSIETKSPAHIIDRLKSLQ
jgi:hypothetical protein